ncbi:MAG: hypothetical protein MUR21_00865 [OM182 bacterium]|uniref:Lipoprotein n=2 Tax=OM182 clade TaxID=745002 RepID=A0A0R2SV87_9GAMM|nr:MAG: hypothetical protein ABR85_12455 [OM182 bacterium BACL3 MAG-120619-bin3]MBT3521727.1 hypothetical protein [Gammaproteobacteria bacterium]MDO7656743.1 hypothetical protein [OM182 bacterium]MBT6317194.1 hypothetical protein [Gammaproteobacteria bacterium]MBT6549062.1 hypothetical protein [Gammaproteobacteria bacterium]
MKALLPLLVVLLASCTSTTVDEFRQGATGINSDESVVILGRRHSSDYETRAEFVDCVGERMTTGNDALSVIPEKQFVDAMFPWFEPRTAPLRTRDLERLMSEPVVADKMAEFGVRYMVWLDGFTETSGRTGTISCTVGPGGAGCFGFGSWEDDSTFDARVWDVASLQNVGTISTDATGQSYVPALVIPIPLIARVEANACIRLADQLKQFVNGE